MLPNWYLEYKNLIDDSVEEYLNNYFESEKNSGLEKIKQATLYSCKGGKRIRSILALEFFLIFSKKDIKDIKKSDDIIKFCIILELIHSYSLVHDDLPAMDNDELRRGKLTTWKKYGETNALLVGDLLNSISFEILGSINNQKGLISTFGEAIGLKGMLGGQVLDLYYEKNPEKLTLENLVETHNKKTGKLIEASISGGLKLVEDGGYLIKDIEIKKYKKFGEKIGLAFQVKDDLLDVEGTIKETGKTVGDGEEKGFVYFLGLEKTHKYLDNLITDSKKIILSLNSDKLNFLVEYIGNRKK